MTDRTHSHDTSTPAMSAETVPSEEFVLVPREPTREMFVAMTWGFNVYGGLPGAYRAVIEKFAAAPTLSASHIAKEGGEAGAVEAAYRKGVLDACELVGPPDDMADKELTEHGRLKRDAMHYARRELLKPLSVARAVSSHPQPSPALAKGGDAVREVLETARDYISDAAAGTLTYEDGGEGFKAMAVEDLARLDALRAALSTPTEGPASHTEGMGGDAVRKLPIKALDWHGDHMCAEAWTETLTTAYIVGIVTGYQCVEDATYYAIFNARYFGRDYPSLDAAKAACQADYERRIRAALTPPETAEAVPVAGEPDTSAADREALELQWGKQTPEGVWVASPQRSVLVRCCAHFEGEIVPVHVKETADGFTIEPVASSEAAHLREELERVTRDLASAVEKLEHNHTVKGELRFERNTAIRERDDAVKALETARTVAASDPAPATDDRERMVEENARLQSAMLILGAYLLEKGEAFRVGEGAELVDAYSAALATEASR